jgi:hypothetical protein
MSEIDRIADVQIGINDAITDDFDFNAVNLLGTSTVISTDERIRTYTSLDAISLDFGANADETKAATIFFARTPRPTKLLVSRWANTDTAAELRGGLLATTAIAEWIVITDGSFRINIDGTLQNVDGLDFSGSTNLANVASVVQTGIQTAGFANATCTYNTVEKRFIIKSGTTGATSTIAILSTSTGTFGTDISGLGGSPFLDCAANASVIQGINAEQVDEALTIIEQKNPNWYALMTTSVIRDDSNARVVSAWVQARVKVYALLTNDPNSSNSENTTNIINELKDLNRDRTFPVYNIKPLEYSDASVSGELAIQEPGTNTFKFKAPASGVTASDELTTTQIDVIRSRNCNIYRTVGGSAIFMEGVASSGRFMDLRIGVDAMRFEIQRNIISKLKNTKVVRMTDAGVSLIELEVKRVLDVYVNKGFLADRPIFDSNGELIEVLPAYTITSAKVSSIPEAQRIARIAPTISFTAYAGGAIHFVKVRGEINI